MIFKEFLIKISSQIRKLSEINDDGGKPEYRYHLFILIGVGIEMLGAALDKYDWFKRGESRNRFNKALENYTSLQKYQHKDLYDHLRCGMCHVYVPNKHIALNSVKEEGKNLEQINSDQILIQFESFLEDFLNAVIELEKNIDSEIRTLPIKHIDKLKKEHLAVPTS